ncbi:hypothetical protein PSYAE_23918 [Pseudomonas amygdali pv. aesculi str. 0893_23]|uniref:Uncharacterized protein n=1 Tax=Pseudomonas meliae TaxID=86176 RepID=A0A0P9V836_9PSED|nr:hypothetical protein PSYAE_23918 [Pseudomonas amygdali pv. aesculi str. 0893_23]KPW26541.1 Uncharacterized protein ALO90_02610 [Pseudomonas amygdali pv. aesculi]KPX86408.1 Uncharacterized protein ALO64_00473 [Pseudomonas meliae]
MSHEMAGIAILMFMFFSVGGVGLYASWPDIKRALQSRH